MTEPFWRIENQTGGMMLSKDARNVLLPWTFLARVSRWKGPANGSAPVAFPDDTVRITVDTHGINVKVRESPRAIRLPFEMLRTALEKSHEAA